MSSYYPSFSYMGINSLNDKNLIVVHFEADEREHDTFLGMDSIYTEKYDGSRRLDYGAKFNSVATIKITVIKSCMNDFTVAEVRDFLRWVTGVRQISYLDLLIGNEVQFSFLGRVINAYQQKLDARTVGMSLEFESISPWAYSPIQTHTCSFDQVLAVDNGVLYNEENETSLKVDNDGVLYNNDETLSINNGVTYVENSVVLTIDNETDDLYTPIYLNTVFTNNNSDYLSIKNATTGEETVITDMVANEVIKLSAEQFIISDVPGKIFGSTFNFVWPRLIPGENELVIDGSGSGSLEFTYRYPIKIGDCAMNVFDVIEDSECGKRQTSNILGIGVLGKMILGRSA